MTAQRRAGYSHRRTKGEDRISPKLANEDIAGGAVTYCFMHKDAPAARKQAAKKGKGDSDEDDDDDVGAAAAAAGDEGGSASDSDAGESGDAADSGADSGADDE